MLTRPLHTSVSVISAITLTLGAAVLPGVTLGSLPSASAAPACPSPVAPTPNVNGQYELSTAAHLQWVKETFASWGDNFLMTGDIDMSGCTWDAGIGSATNAFTGTFNGNDFAIKELTVQVVGIPVQQDAGVAGLFGLLGSGAIVTDLTVTGSVSADIGSFAPAEPFAYAGGVAGRAVGASLSNVHFTGSVTSEAAANHSYAGGIVGAASGSTLTGVSASTATTARSFGRPMGGGIAGEVLGNTTIAESWSVGSVFVDGTDESRAGGIAGSATGGSIERSFSMAHVTAAPALEPSAGGIAGVAESNIVDSYSRSTVRGSGFTGGLVGWLVQDDPQYKIQRSYYSGSIGNPIPTPTIGGIGGRSRTPNNNDDPVLMIDTLWDTTTTGIAVPVGASQSGTINPPVTGAVGEPTADMKLLATYDDSNWSIASGDDTNYTWGICSGYNDGYPFLTSLFGSDPCGGSPAASITATTPNLQTFSGEVGTNVTTSAFTFVGFEGQPVFTVSPPLPPGLTLDPLTGKVSGVVGLSQKATTYIVTATNGVPYQTATSTLVQTGATTLPGQLSTSSPDEDVNGLFQSVATAPDGRSLSVSYGNLYNSDGNRAVTLTAYLADSSGALIGNGVNFLPAGVSVGVWSQPSVAHNPATGGWFVCYARMLPAQKVQPTCQYLDAAGAPQGSAFAVVAQQSEEGGWNQTAMAYNATTEQFLVAATLKNAGPYARFVDANGAGVVGSIIDLRTASGVTFSPEGGLDLAFSPVSQTYGLVTRAKVNGTTEARAPWLFHLNAAATPTGVPERILDDTAVELTSGSVAYNAADEAFMVVAWERGGARPLWAQRFSAANGAQVGAPADTQVPVGTQSWGSRPVIAAHTDASEYVVTAPMQLQNDANTLYYAYRLDSDGVAVGGEELIAGSAGTAAGVRPRLAFNEATCEYTTSYQVNDPSWGWQLFSGAISTTYPCSASTPPSAPLNATATAGDARATVAWQVPNSAGTSAITAYQVTATPGGATCSATAPAVTCEVTGLTNGTSYTFEVRAQNGSGWGPFSQASNSVTPVGGPGPGPAPGPTPGTPPSAPLSVTATAGDTTAVVTWRAPASPGSSAITAYQVTSTPGGGMCLATAPTLTCKVVGLRNGTSYTFSVQALNAAGWSEVSAPSNAVTPQADAQQAIVITGSRTNDGKGRRIVVEGSTTGMSGMMVTPHFRFPGRSDYRAGVLPVPIDDNGAFRWSRNTSRKIFVYFDGGGVRSNTVVIAAR